MRNAENFFEENITLRIIIDIHLQEMCSCDIYIYKKDRLILI